MAKNTSKKINELRGEKPTKISNEHLKKMQNIINNINRGQMEIGTLEHQQISIIIQALVMICNGYGIRIL